MRFPLALLSTLLLCTGARAQTVPDRGVSTTRSPETIQGVRDIQALDALMFYIPGIGSPSREELLRQNIKSYMMPIREAPDTRAEWAYALTSALEFYLNLNNNFKDNLSPDYLSMSLANQGTRPNIEDGLRLLIQQGTVSANIVPYGSATIPGAVYSVPKFKITNFGYLFQEDTKARNRIFETKKSLSRGNPVLVELRTPPGFAQSRTGEYQPVGAGVESHFLNVVGYESTTETFELRGSFGRLWGDAGYVRLSFRDFAAMAVKGYVLIPAAPE